VTENEIIVGTAGRRHLHPDITQVYYVLAGNAVVHIGGTSVAVWPGQAIEIGPGDAHQITNEADTTLRFLVISSGQPRNDREDLQ
jgi:mannose-6-phosphate isomerase-like protein (cupin superfamily)